MICNLKPELFYGDFNLDGDHIKVGDQEIPKDIFLKLYEEYQDNDVSPFKPTKNIAFQHLNLNPICAMDTETTGLDPTVHEILEIAIIPLDANLFPRTDVLPFHQYLKPDHPEYADPEAMKVNKIDMAKIMRFGTDKLRATDLLTEWIEKSLKLSTTKWGTPKRIVPLGQNYAFDKSFIAPWFGLKQYEYYFHYHYRDTMQGAAFMNDRAAFHTDEVPFKKLDLVWLCNVLKVRRLCNHSALEDARVAAECYRKMMTYSFMQ